MIGFPSFLVYCLTASIIAGFGVQGVLLQRLSLTETVLYCAARIVIVFASGLFASVLYRRFADQGMTWYKRLAVVVMLIGALYSMTETFFGRAAVSLNSYQQQSADLSEAKVKQSAAEALTGSAEASTSASKRFASSNKRGSLWGQVETAKSATTNATAAVGLSEQAAKLQREAGVTEQQVMAMVSPWEPLPTQLAMSAWFAVLVELVMLLSAGGAADYIASRSKDTKNTTPPRQRSDDNVVPMPSPTTRTARQRGRMQVADDAGAAPQAVPDTAPKRTQAVPDKLYRTPSASTARVQHSDDASTAPSTAAVSPNGPLTDDEYRVFVRALANGLEPSTRKLRAVYPVGQRKAQSVLTRMQDDGLINPTTGPSGRVLGYKRAAA